MADTCDIGVHFRDWLLAIPEVAEWLGEDQAVLDTIDEDSCPPMIWYSRSGTRNSDLLTGCGSGLPEEVAYEVEVIGHERMLHETRRIAELIRNAADDHAIATPFGTPDSDLYVQMIEVIEVDDDYVPRAFPFIEGACFTAFKVEITPL